MEVTELNDIIIKRLSQRDEGKTFEYVLNDIFDMFMSCYVNEEEISCKEIRIYRNDNTFRTLSRYIFLITSKISNKYLRGDIVSAFNSFTSLWKKGHEKTYRDPCSSYASHLWLTTEEKCFRIRLKETNKIFSRKDMFHVPFSLREKISTNRFSIPGFPCLYLGKSILTCWEELHRPALSSFDVIGFKLEQKIKLLDLRFKDSFENQDDLRKYIMILPLIIACTIKRRNIKSAFCPEYIFPQIMLHSILQDRKNIDGIIFTSSEYASSNMNKDIRLYDNIVIPVKHVNKDDYCPQLCEMFSLSNPVDFESEMIKGIFMNKNGERENNTDYDKSLFGIMENHIKQDEFHSITPNGEEIKPKGNKNV